MHLDPSVLFLAQLLQPGRDPSAQLQCALPQDSSKSSGLCINNCTFYSNDQSKQKEKVMRCFWKNVVLRRLFFYKKKKSGHFLEHDNCKFCLSAATSLVETLHFYCKYHTVTKPGLNVYPLTKTSSQNSSSFKEIFF